MVAQVMGECIASRFWKGLPVARLLELAKDLLVAVKGQVFPIELEGRAPELRKQHLVTLLELGRNGLPVLSHAPRSDGDDNPLVHLGSRVGQQNARGGPH